MRIDFNKVRKKLYHCPLHKKWYNSPTEKKYWVIPSTRINSRAKSLILIR